MNSPLIASTRRNFDDKTPPSTPKIPTASSICQTTFTLNWLASTDNVGVTGYKVYENGGFPTDVGLVLSKAIVGRSAGSTANWSVSAYDAADNDSGESPDRSVTQGSAVTLVEISFEGNSTRALACGEITDSFYNDGGSTVSNGDKLYNDACAQSTLNGGGDFWSDGDNSFIVSSVGVVSSVQACL